MFSGTSSERASERVTRIIIKDLRPINMVSGEGFRDLMAFMEPEYHLPSATHFTHLIERRYEVVKEKMRGIFCADSVAITADIWTSIATDSYLTVIIYYLNEKWEMKSIVSGTLPLLESHTADNLADQLEYTAPTGFRFLDEPMFCFSTLNANTNPNPNCRPGHRPWPLTPWQSLPGHRPWPLT